MNGLSDLDLVAQAMAPTTQPTKSHPNSDSTVPADQRDTDVPTEKPVISEEIDETTLKTLEELGIDLNTLSIEDKKQIQPLLDALMMDAEEGDDELKIAEILAQMDIASGVADDLEEKLDVLLASLGKVEQEMQAGLPDKK